MTNLLRGVVQRGTAPAAASLDWPLAGKTGTMDEYTDAWFVGFDPNISVGVWVGYDEKKPLGNGETGATAALPIWMDFMKAYIEKRAIERPPTFDPPGTSSSSRSTRASTKRSSTARSRSRPKPPGARSAPESSRFPRTRCRPRRRRPRPPPHSSGGV